MCDRYPQYLDPRRFAAEPLYTYLNKEEERKALLIQRHIRARRTYSELGTGEFWKQIDQLGNDPLNLRRFKQLSSDNINNLVAELGTLSSEEKTFMRMLCSQKVELAHYTNSADKIMESGVMLSRTALLRMFGPGNFTDNSGLDIAYLANGASVFFRYEISHQSHLNSRFGMEQIIINGDDTALFKTGWVSLYEMLDPQTASITKELVNAGEILRISEGPL